MYTNLTKQLNNKIIKPTKNKLEYKERKIVLSYNC